MEYRSLRPDEGQREDDGVGGHRETHSVPTKIVDCAVPKAEVRVPKGLMDQTSASDGVDEGQTPRTGGGSGSSEDESRHS